MAIDGDAVVIVAVIEDSGATGATGVGGNECNTPRFFDSGAAYVFRRIGQTWTQHAYLKASNTGANI